MPTKTISQEVMDHCWKMLDSFAKWLQKKKHTPVGVVPMACDADMIWLDYDSEMLFHTIDDAVEYEVNNAWPVDVQIPSNCELELKLKLAKRIPTANVRIFNITENGHEWQFLNN